MLQPLYSKLYFICSFWRLKFLVLWQKIVYNLLIFVYIYFVQKAAQLILWKSGWLWKTVRTLLILHFNALSIGVQYTLSCQWTKFGLKCLSKEQPCNETNGVLILLKIISKVNLQYRFLVKLFLASEKQTNKWSFFLQ